MAQAKDVITGLELLSKYAGGADCQIGGANYDIIFGPDVPRSDISDEDWVILDVAGWFWSEEFQTWAIFV